MAKACPKGLHEYVARTKKIVDYYIKDIDSESQAYTIKSLVEQMEAVNPEKAVIFRNVVKATHPEHIVDYALSNEIDISKAPAEALAVDPLPFIDEITEIERQYDAGLEQEDKDNNGKDQF